MRRLEGRVARTQLRWLPAVWALAGAEVLVMLWFHVSRIPADVSLDGYLWQFGVLLGVENEFPGVLRALSAVNTLVVVGLWITVRRRAGTGSRSAAVGGLAASLAFLAIGWWSVRMAEQYRPIETKAVYRLAADGEYRVDVVGRRR